MRAMDHNGLRHQHPLALTLVSTENSRYAAMRMRVAE